MHNSLKIYNKDAIEKLIEEIKNYIAISNVQDIKNLFSSNSNRFDEFSCQNSDLLFDFSKTPIDNTILDYLLKIVDLAQIESLRDAMFNGEKINRSEDRAVLHMSLRATPDLVEPRTELFSQIYIELQKMRLFCESIYNGTYVGFTGKIITDIVNIGIGGSDLGPRMVVKALSPYSDKIKCHFVSNVDSADIADCLKGLNAETTLFIVTSKTFSTIETLENAKYAKLWLRNKLSTELLDNHFVAITSAVEKAIKFGIKADNCFAFWDWVGGRYSLWSAVGLPIMLTIGYDNFKQLLDGAYNMDQHFLNAEPRNNIAILFGVINYYYRICCGYNNVAVIPYEQRLEFLPFYLQQLLMESNGKTVTRDGKFIKNPTGSIIWGGVGTNAQHAFFQYLHQGSDITPVEFIAFSQGFENCPQGHKQRLILLANCLAQSEALLEGSDFETEKKYKSFVGNRPSITILFEKLSPYQLGQLLSLYEHRTFVEGALFNINSFDQWGVELGKELAKKKCNKKESSTAEKNYNEKLLKFLRKTNNNI